MNADSRNEPNDVSLDWIKEQLQAMAAVEPPKELREKLRTAIPCRSADMASPGRTWGWVGGTGWAGIAATIVVLCGVLQLWTPAQLSVGPEPDAGGSRLGLVVAADYNNSLGQMLVTDYNSMHPPDINALDSNSVQ